MRSKQIRKGAIERSSRKENSRICRGICSQEEYGGKKWLKGIAFEGIAFDGTAFDGIAFEVYSKGICSAEYCPAYGGNQRVKESKGTSK